ncbi:hypothetical protein SESBI_09102 [Sesbania bispinosa]|nr:hypothetical protein SESBI_09102 [Sesbania bispinosa]
MAEIPVSNENPLTMEQRMERLERSFSQILDLLKTMIPAKEVVNDNSNNDENGDGGPSIRPTAKIPPREDHPKLGTPHLHKLTMFPFPTIHRPSKYPPYQPRKERVKIDPVPIPYSDLYDTLLQQHLVAPEVPQPVSNPPPNGTIQPKCANTIWEPQVTRLKNVGPLSSECKN